jgi:hypothetical protein
MKALHHAHIVCFVLSLEVKVSFVHVVLLQVLDVIGLVFFKLTLKLLDLLLKHFMIFRFLWVSLRGIDLG